MKALSGEQCAFMIRILGGRFAHHIMNSIEEMSMMWTVSEILVDWLLERKKCKCQPIGNQENKINV
jgi:hypothetical protein